VANSPIPITASTTVSRLLDHVFSFRMGLVLQVK